MPKCVYICLILIGYVGGTVLQDENAVSMASENTACTSGLIMTLKRHESFNITSPGFDKSSYPSNSKCSWTIHAFGGDGRRVHLDFEQLSIWPTYNCLLDGLALYDGNSSDATPLGRYCTSMYPFDLTTSGPVLHMVFYSGSFQQRFYKGFFVMATDLDPEVVCTTREITCRNKKCMRREAWCDGNDDCGDGTDEENCGHKVRHPPCGMTPISPELGNDDRIVGGKAAVPGSWPWQCSLRLSQLPRYGHMCGAVLINDQWLVTAAHCFRDFQNTSLWTAYLGKYYKERKESYEQVRYLKKIVLHPMYKGRSENPEISSRKDNDIALVQLNAPVTMKNNIGPVCLPPWHSEVPAKTICHVTGWGLTLGTGNSEVLKQAAVPIVDDVTCRQTYKNLINVTSSMLCAGFPKGGHDSCKGDSGGPLVLLKNGRWYLVGIVSTGGGCAAALQPGIYTKVSYFKSWIGSIMWRQTRDIRSRAPFEGFMDVPLEELNWWGCKTREYRRKPAFCS